MQADGKMARGRVLVANTAGSRVAHEDAAPRDESLADTVVAAGLLGLIVVLIATTGSELHGLIPDARFWRALPLLLVIPPAVLLGTLFAPVGTRGSRASGVRLVLLGAVGFAAYAGTLGVSLLGSALAHTA